MRTGVTERTLADAFVSGLAHRAGVMTAHDPEGTTSQATLSTFNHLFAGYASVWLHKMRVAKGQAESPEHGYELTDSAGVIRPFQAAFALLDLDKSGYLGAWELREHLRASLGTRVTPQELRTMLAEMGADSKAQKQVGEPLEWVSVECETSSASISMECVGMEELLLAYICGLIQCACGVGGLS